jgi:hypothetical protein
MFIRLSAAALALAAVLAAAACTANRADLRAAYDGAALSREPGSLPPTLFYDVLRAIHLPDDAVAEGDVVAVYRLPGDVPADVWAGNAVDDWLVEQIREAGATAVDGDLCAPAALGGGGGPATARLGAPPARETAPSLLRPTVALGYRVVAAEVWFDPPVTDAHANTLVPAHAWVRINLRKVDLATAEIVWEDTVGYTTKKNVTLARVAGLGGPPNWSAGAYEKSPSKKKAPPPEEVPEPEAGAVTKTVVGNVTTYAGTLRGNNDAARFDLYTPVEYVEVEFTYPETSTFYVKVLGKAGDELGEFDLSKGEIIELSGGGMFTLIVHSTAGGGAWTATYAE